MRALRSVFRRKLRAFLTIFGIAIGVFALIAMGAIAEKLTLLVDGGTEYYKDKVLVSESDLISLTPNPMSVNPGQPTVRFRKALFSRQNLDHRSCTKDQVH